MKIYILEGDEYYMSLYQNIVDFERTDKGYCIPHSFAI